MPTATGLALLAVVTAIIGPVAATTASAIIGFGGTLLAIGVGLGLSLLSSLLFKPSQPKPSDGQTIIKQSAAPRSRSYGRVKVGGVLMFANTLNGFLHRVIAMGSGEIDAVEEHWIDDQRVTLAGNGDVTTSKYVYSGDARVRIDYRLGTDSPAVYAGLQSAFPALWTVDHLGKGIPSAYVRLRQVKAEKISEMFPALANTSYRQVQRGAKVPDIALGALTAPTWSDNAARVILDYLTHPDGLGLDTSWIVNEIDTWAQAIADCDDAIALKAGGTEPRYRIWNTYRFSERPADVLARYLQACDGQLFPTPNNGLALKVGKWSAPTVTVDDAAILGFSEIGRGRDILSTANTIRAQFTSPDHDYLETDADPWTDATDVAERGEYATDIEFYAVPSHAQTRRLMKLAAHRANPDWLGSLTCNLRAMMVLGERFIRVQIAELGIDQDFEVLNVRYLIADGNVLRGLQIDVASLASAAYDWDALTEEGTAPGISAVIVPSNTIPAPTGFDVTISGNTATLVWDDPPEDFFEVEARGKKTAATAWFSIAVADGALQTSVGGLEDGAEYEFQVRHLSTATGRHSDWTASVVRTVTADAIAPGPVSGLTATVSGSDVELAWTAPNSPNFDHAKVYRASWQNDQVVNGGFATDADWTKGAGWSIAAGVASKSPGTTSFLSQPMTFVEGRNYQVTFDVVRVDAGSVSPRFTGGTLVTGTERDTVGTYTEVLTAASGNIGFAVRGLSTFDGDIDNVIVKPAPVFAGSSVIATRFGSANAAQSHADTGLAAGNYWYWVTAANASDVESAEEATGETTVP